MNTEKSRTSLAWLAGLVWLATLTPAARAESAGQTSDPVYSLGAP